LPLRRTTTIPTTITLVGAIAITGTIGGIATTDIIVTGVKVKAYKKELAL
jgi:hypothetical protein